MRQNYSNAKTAKPDSSEILQRERLFKELDKARKSPVIWLSAPGGSGKTSLISSYLKNRKIPSVWYHVDAGDADIATLFYYMGLAAKKAAPRYKTDLPVLTPEYMLNLNVFTLRYFEQLYSRLKPPFTIIFDNYQDVGETHLFHDAIAAAAGIIPKDINIVVLSRKEPPPQFSRLIANNAIYSMKWDTIRFNSDETKDFIANKMINEVNISLVHQATDGWAAGLVFMLNQGRITFDDSHLGEGKEQAFNYFANEIYKKADAKMQEFLLKTAFLPEMSAQTAEKLTEETSSNHILSQLKKNNYFIQQITPVGYYCYHPLFREFLLTVAKDYFNENQLKQIRQKAAIILADSGDIEGALQLFASSSDWGNAIKMILSHAQVLITQGRNRTLIEWINNLPENVRDNNPWLLYWLAVALSSFDPGKSRVLFSRAHQIFEDQQQNTGTLLAWSGIMQSTLFEFHDFRPLEPWITWFENYTKNNISFPSPEVEISVIGGITGILAYTKPGLNNKEYWLKRALQLCRENHNPDISVRIYTNILFNHIWMGEFAQADILLREMNSIIQLYPASPLRLIIARIAEAMLYNSSVEYSQQAVSSISEGLMIAEKSGVDIMSSMLFLHGVVGFLNQNDIKNAKEFLSNMEKRIGKKHLHLCLYYFILAWYELITGEAGKAVISAQKSVQLVEMVGAPFIETILRLTLINASYANGNIGVCRRELEIVKELISRTESSYASYIYYLTESYHAFEQNDDVAGIVSLRAAMEIGKHNNYTTMVYFWRPEFMSKLCAKALEIGIEVKYAQLLIQKLNLSASKDHKHIENWPYPIRIKTLGSFEVYINDKPLPLTGQSQQKPFEMLKAIIALGGENIQCEKVSDLLWPEADGDMAYKVFTTTLQRLRKTLDNKEAIILDDGKISLDPRYIWIDIYPFMGLSEQAETQIKDKKTDMGEIEKLAQKAIMLYRGHFLEKDRESPWILPLRERLKYDFSAIIEKAGQYMEDNNKPEKAAEYYLNTLKIDSFSEMPYQKLMKMYQKDGRHLDAVRIYQRYENAIIKALGIKPSEDILSIYNTSLAALSK